MPLGMEYISKDRLDPFTEEVYVGLALVAYNAVSL